MNFRTSPPCVADRGDLAVEIAIENIDHGLGRQPVRQRGEAAQIRQPDRGMHRLGVAAAICPPRIRSPARLPT
jgi:hypothetical protein